MSAPDFTRIAGELADKFKRAAFDRLMHEDGCPEGEQIKAGIAAIAPAIYRAGQEEMRERAAKVAKYRHENWRMPHPEDAKAGEVCCDVTACADIAAAIRSLKVEDSA